MATAAQWISGARPRTLPVGAAPVLVGSAAAFLFARTNQGWFAYAPLSGETFVPPDLPSWGWRETGLAVLALVVALALQVAVNYANDYSDGVRGTDDERVGPFRLTGSGAASPAAVKRAAFAAFGVAAVAGLALAVLSGHLWLIAAGAVCMLAAWFYTGGRNPYGYAGLGEVSVFVFFGLAATLGTTYTQVDRLTGPAWAGAVGTGALACAVMVANNLRDIPTDSVAGKRTLAVRLGDAWTRRLFVLLLAAPFVAVFFVVADAPAAAIALGAALLAFGPATTVLDGARGPALIPVLKDTGRLDLVYAVLLSAGLVWAALA